MTNSQVPILYQVFSKRITQNFPLENQALSKIRILDLGCGTGDQMAYMTCLGFKMSGCDIGSNFIEATLAALKRVDSITNDVRLSKSPSEIPFETGQFHAVYANGVFEHCPEMPSLIAEISRVLIPGGIFLAAFPLRSVLIEPHLGLPFVHWFSKGPIQRLLIRTVSSLFHPARNCQSIERYLQNDVFYWTFGQINQILNRYFEQTNDLANEYIMVAKKQRIRNLLVRLTLAGTAVPLFSPILEYVLSWQWAYVFEASNPIKLTSSSPSDRGPIR